MCRAVTATWIFALSSMFCVIAHAAQPPLVTEIKLSPTDTPLTTETVTFTAQASSPAGLPLTYHWHFGDGTAAASKEPSVSHLYTASGHFDVSLEVNDGVNPGVMQITFVDVIDPPVENAILGSNAGDIQINPANGLAVTVAMSQGGVVELLIDDSSLALARPNREVRTDFGDGLGRNAIGTNPRHKYVSEGIYVVKTTVIELDSGSEVASIRKTIAISTSDLGLETDSIELPSNRQIKISQLKGKFTFSDPTRNDQVAAALRIHLPAGTKLGVARDVWLAAGNIVGRIALDSTGKGVGSERFKKVSIKYSKLANRTATSDDQLATINLTMAAPDLDDNGFDTDGIYAGPRNGSPSIQFAFIIDGVAYSGKAFVDFQVNLRKNSGIIKGLAPK